MVTTAQIYNNDVIKANYSEYIAVNCLNKN